MRKISKMGLDSNTLFKSSKSSRKDLLDYEHEGNKSPERQNSARPSVFSDNALNSNNNNKANSESSSSKPSSIPIRVAMGSQKMVEVFRDEDFLTEVELRAKRNRFFGTFYKLVVNVWFNFCIYILILLNTVTLALYRFD